MTSLVVIPLLASMLLMAAVDVNAVADGDQSVALEDRPVPGRPDAFDDETARLPSAGWTTLTESNGDSDQELADAITRWYASQRPRATSAAATGAQVPTSFSIGDVIDDGTAEVVKRFSEFLGGRRKRFSEFLGGKKRFSEFLGGKKRFSEFLGGKKRFSEFLGGK